MAGIKEAVFLATVSLSIAFQHADTPQLRRMRASPMFWLHIPKCGTSFGNAITHLPGFCPGLQKNDSLSDTTIFGSCFGDGFQKACAEICDQKHMHCNFPPIINPSHQFLTDEKYQTHKGRFVAMFRQPEQRVLSAWHDNFRVFRADPFPVSACRNETFTKELPMETFTSKWGSWETGQIVGKGPNLFGEMTVSADDVPKALERLEEGFAFVGLQEEWELSICLFHAKFGGPCLSVDFQNTRPTMGSQGSSVYDTSLLKGWTDEPDRQVYAKAKELFEKDLSEYGISHETCKPCYHEAGLDMN